MFRFFRDWEKNNKKIFHSVEIGNDIHIYINIKRVFFDSLIKSTVYLLIFRHITGGVFNLGSLNSPFHQSYVSMCVGASWEIAKVFLKSLVYM